MRMMNEELPYEQQMMLILKSYDNLVNENKKLKEAIKHLEKTVENTEKKAEKNLSRKKKNFDRDMKHLKTIYDQKCEKIEWIQKTLEGYLVSLGVELPEYRTITAIVKMIVKI